MTSTKNLVKFYDAEAASVERYASKYFWERRYHTKRMTVLLRFLKDMLPNCDAFLDIGCGAGEFLLFAKQYLPRVVGLDLSTRYLLRCKSHRVTDLIQSDVRALPFKDLAFDCVLCSEVLEHVQNQHAAISEIFRVARKFVLLSTPNQGMLRIFMSQLGKQFLARIDVRVGHVNILKFRDLIGRLKSQRWKASSAFTIHLTPPIMDTIHLPRVIAPFVDAMEYFLNRLLPYSGNTSVVYIKRVSL